MAYFVHILILFPLSILLVAPIHTVLPSRSCPASLQPHIPASQWSSSFRLQAGYLTLYCRTENPVTPSYWEDWCMSKKPLTSYQDTDPKFLPHCWNNQQFLKSSVQKRHLTCPLEIFNAKKKGFEELWTAKYQLMRNRLGLVHPHCKYVKWMPLPSQSKVHKHKIIRLPR